MRYTKKDFDKHYPDDRTCLLKVLENRYEGTCPRCGTIGVKFHPITGRQGFVCSECDRHIYPLAGTIFRNTKTPLKDWFYAIYLFSVSKNGISAAELQRHLGVTYKCAWRMCKQIRLLMEQDDNTQLKGEVEVDETYIGGKHERKYGRSKKEIVFGAVERGGKARAKHVKSAGGRVLMPEIQQSIAPGTHIHSDEWQAYKTLHKRGYTHTTVNHGRLEYVRGTTHTNTIEGMWCHLKNAIRGTYYGVSPKYLQTYVDQFVFMYNYRTTAVFPVLLERAWKLS